MITWHAQNIYSNIRHHFPITCTLPLAPIAQQHPFCTLNRNFQNIFKDILRLICLLVQKFVLFIYVYAWYTFLQTFLAPAILLNQCCHTTGAVSMTCALPTWMTTSSVTRWRSTLPGASSRRHGNMRMTSVVSLVNQTLTHSWLIRVYSFWELWTMCVHSKNQIVFNRLGSRIVHRVEQSGGTLSGIVYILSQWPWYWSLPLHTPECCQV